MWLDLGEYRGPSRFHAFVMFASARRRDRAHRQAWMNYVSETLRMIPQNMYPTRSFADMVRPRQDINVDAIIEHVANVMGE